MISILLRFPHGLGDVVQFSVILKHLREKRPDWTIDVRCGQGKHTALIGQCNRVWHDHQPEPPGPYDSVADLGWFENYERYADRPNTKITNCLAHVFGIDYDSSLGRYEIRLPADARERASNYLYSIGARQEGAKYNTVIVHGEGNTSPWKKNMKQFQIQAICDMIIRAGRIPVVLDWDKRSPIPDQKRIFCPRPGEGDIWGGFGSGDAATIAAMVNWSEAFVGIDSGPGKCASAVDTPSLICWMDHHPMQFHDPAPYTTHMIPTNWRQIPPCEHDGVAKYFEGHYRFRTYSGGEMGMVEEIQRWLGEALQYMPALGVDSVPFVLPQGIGDTIWALTKIRAIAQDKPIHLVLTGNPDKEIDRRSLRFLERFPFVQSVRVLDVPILEDQENRNDAQGRYRYVSDGIRAGFHFLMPNKALEHGQRLEDWLPEYPIDWNIMDFFCWDGTERGNDLGKSLSPFVAFYLGPESGHADEGHNRGWLWEPKHWIELGLLLKERGVGIAVVGAAYDRSFWERYCQQGFREAGVPVTDLIGALEIFDTFALLRHSKVFVSYQCGLAICAHYLGVPVACWWRPDGDSCHPSRLVAFDERMKDGWVNPEYKDRYLGMLYKRETPKDIAEWIDRGGWLK